MKKFSEFLAKLVVVKFFGREIVQICIWALKIQNRNFIFLHAPKLNEWKKSFVCRTYMSRYCHKCGSLSWRGYWPTVRAATKLAWPNSWVRAVAQSWRRGGNASNNCTAMAQLGTAAEFFGSMSSHGEDVGRKFCEQDMDQCNIKVWVISHRKLDKKSNRKYNRKFDRKFDRKLDRK